MMQPDDIRADLVAMPGIVATAAWGETSFFYNPDNRLSRGTYFATIKDHDGANDRASALDRPGIWRVNFGVGRKAYADLFGAPPPRPPKGGVVAGPWDFTALDRLMPHPVYGWMGWVAVLCPSAVTWAACAPLLADAHARATFARRLRRSGGDP
ncbi:MAG: DUF6194 family protein [Pseudomonadota bacterium]